MTISSSRLSAESSGLLSLALAADNGTVLKPLLRSDS
jgi:hypothetical protein